MSTDSCTIQFDGSRTFMIEGEGPLGVKDARDRVMAQGFTSPQASAYLLLLSNDASERNHDFLNGSTVENKAL